MTRPQLLKTLFKKYNASSVTALQISIQTGVPRKTVYNILSGKNCKLDNLLKVCEFLDLNIRLEEYPPEH